MANICDFEMMVCGEKSNVDAFLDCLQQKHKYSMGRGAEIYGEEYDAEAKTLFCYGDCKWSVLSSLVSCAEEMRHQKKTGEGAWVHDFIQKHDFLTLWEACEMFNVNVEIYSTEPGMGFAEHYVYQDGERIEDCVDYMEIQYSKEEYPSPEDFEEFKKLVKLPTSYSQDDVGEDSWFEVGGFDREFTVTYPKQKN